MGGILESVGDFIFGDDDASDAAKDAAKIQANAQIEALEYLKEREELPQGYREAALQQLGSLYGFELQPYDESRPGEAIGGPAGTRRVPIYGTKSVLNPAWRGGRDSYDPSIPRFINKRSITGWNEIPIDVEGNIIPEDERGDQIAYTGGTGGQQDLIDRAMNSPLYQALMGGQNLGEEVIMRNAAATGGLRSGNVQGNMFDYITQLQNKALLSSYNEQLAGLTGLAGLPSNANNIAQQTSDIGTTQAQGVLGAAQTEAAQSQQRANNLLSGLGVWAMFSDRRLKKNISRIGEINGHDFYSFEWNKLANELGLSGNTYGCMADEVYKIDSKAVFLKDGFMMVNYSRIGVL
jgi:hypothetical protein